MNGPAGERYGWGDLLTGIIEVTEPSRHELVETLVCGHPAWTSRGGTAVASAKSGPLVSPPPSSDAKTVEPRVDIGVAAVAGNSQPWSDLALNKPGEGARSQATELRAAAPVRTFVARLVGVHTNERAWRIGADGEESVARELAKLGDAWRTLHSVPVGRNGADIDHVLIGPGGASTINAKNHPGARIWVGGDTILIGQAPVPYVRNARFEATRATRLLSSALDERVQRHGQVRGPDVRRPCPSVVPG